MNITSLTTPTKFFSRTKVLSSQYRKRRVRVAGGRGSVKTKRSKKKVGTTIRVDLLQKTALLGTAHILRRVLQSS